MTTSRQPTTAEVLEDVRAVIRAHDERKMAELRANRPERAIAILSEQSRRRSNSPGLAELMFQAYRKLESPWIHPETAVWARRVRDPKVRPEALAYLKSLAPPPPPPVPPPPPPSSHGPDEF